MRRITLNKNFENKIKSVVYTWVLMNYDSIRLCNISSLEQVHNRSVIFKIIKRQTSKSFLFIDVGSADLCHKVNLWLNSLNTVINKWIKRNHFFFWRKGLIDSWPYQIFIALRRMVVALDSRLVVFHNPTLRVPKCLYGEGLYKWLTIDRNQGSVQRECR